MYNLTTTVRSQNFTMYNCMDHEKPFLTSDEILRTALKTLDPFPQNYSTDVMLGNLVLPQGCQIIDLP